MYFGFGALTWLRFVVKSVQGHCQLSPTKPSSAAHKDRTCSQNSHQPILNQCTQTSQAMFKLLSLLLSLTTLAASATIDVNLVSKPSGQYLTLILTLALQSPNVSVNLSRRDGPCFESSYLCCDSVHAVSTEHITSLDIFSNAPHRPALPRQASCSLEQT